MTQDEKKKAAADAALELIEPGMTVGVGTGSTADHFIDGLAALRTRIEATVASSEASAERLRGHGIAVRDLTAVDEVDIYVDGADEATRARQLVKGGGGALTREKILAEAAKRFVCIVDDSKVVEVLGGFPLPVEVIAMARGLVSRKLVALGGQPGLREGFVTDNGHPIIDVRGLSILEPPALETTLNQIPGVVTNGLFALRRADLLLVGGEAGVERIE